MKTLQQKPEFNREIENKVVFMTYITAKFARAYKMSKPNAYLYLKKYGGWDYLNECWWALHTDNPMWAVRDIYLFCRNNGGLK